MCKLFPKWMPRLLTPDKKQHRIEDLEHYLELFKRGKKNFLRRYVTNDEKWIYHCTPETNGSSPEWTASGDSRPKLLESQEWAAKVMALLCGEFPLFSKFDRRISE